MSGSFESVRWNACEYRLDLGLYSHRKELGGGGGNGVRTHVNSKEKIPSTRKILPRGGSNPRRCIKQTASPTNHQRAIPAPIPSCLIQQRTTFKQNSTWQVEHLVDLDQQPRLEAVAHAALQAEVAGRLGRGQLGLDV